MKLGEGRRPHPPAATPPLGNTYECRLFPQVDVDGVDEYSARCLDLWDTYYKGLSFTLIAGEVAMSLPLGMLALSSSRHSLSANKVTNKTING